MTSTVQVSGQKAARPGARWQALTGIKFDWAMSVLIAWWVGGLFLDGWAHTHGKVDQSFLTPWHAVFYSGYMVVAGLLVITVLQRARAGQRGWAAVPAGYELSLVGVLIFGFGGVGDFIWHTLFGIEADTEALLSPTHLVLATGLILAISGPLRAQWRRPAAAPSLRSLLPTLLSLAFVLSVFTFLTQYAHPLVQTWAATLPGTVEPTSQLYVMNADGTGQTRLSNDPATRYVHPVYSPDGQKLAFTRGSDRGSQVYVADADGSNAIALTHEPGFSQSPAWSPDGRQIVFTFDHDGDYQIWLMNADGQGRTRLTEDGSNLYPAWSADGRQVAFTGIRNGDWQVYVMNADGSGQTRLTAGNRGNYFPQWSPNRSQILFTSVRDGHNQIYVMNPDGSDQVRLTHDADDNRFGRWSPDGKKIAFASSREGNFDVYVMNADGTGQTDLTRNPALESGGLQSWSPDGSKIIFTAEGHPQQPGWLTTNMGLASILLQAALLAGLVLFALRRWTLPPGSLTLVFTLNGILMSFARDHYELIPVSLAAGLLGDLLLWRLRPSTARPRTVHLFAFLMPAIYFGLYFVALMLTKGIGWSIHLWMGSIFIAGIVGLLLSYLLLPPPVPAD